MKNLPGWIKDCLITDVKTIEEFAYKYRKAERFQQRGREYEKAILNSHINEIKEKGYTCISKHDNITGKFICFVPNYNFV